MAKRPCPGPAGAGCPTGSLVAKGTPRCPACSTTYEQRRGSSSARGYGHQHRALRQSWQRRLDNGEHINCWRCRKPVGPTSWQLGHCDINRRAYHGPEHPACNLATSGRIGCPHPSHN